MPRYHAEVRRDRAQRDRHLISNKLPVCRRSPHKGPAGLEFCLHRSDIVDKSGQFSLGKTRASEQVMCPKRFRVRRMAGKS